MKPKKRKDDTGIYMFQWNKELRQTISKNMVAYEQKVRECRELKKQNNELKKLCDKYEKEHNTVFEEWKQIIEEYKQLQQENERLLKKSYSDDVRITKAIEYINCKQFVDGIRIQDIPEKEELLNILKGDSDE